MGNLFAPSPALVAQDTFMQTPPAKLTPQDRWLQMQLETLKKYFDIAQRHQMLKKQQQKQGQVTNRSLEGLAHQLQFHCTGGGGDDLGQTVPDKILDEMLAIGKVNADKIGPLLS